MSNNIAVLVEGLKLCGLNLTRRPNVKWKETMSESDVLDELKKWKTLYQGIAEQNDRLEKRHMAQLAAMKVMRENLNNAQKAVEINKEMLRNSMTEFNAKEQEYIKVMNGLREKLKDVGFSDFNSLGDDGR